MNIRLLRAWLTGVAMTLALLMTSGVLAWQLTAPVRAGGSAAAADNGEYLLVDQAGQICIYSSGSLISNTGIPVRALPELDRIALAQGIHAKGQRQLAALLEDFKGRLLVAFGGEWSVGFLTKHNEGLILDDWLSV